MKKIYLLLLILVVITTTSFTDNHSGFLKTGVYGCNCGKDNPTKVELTINEDFTFHYYDNYDPKKVIDIVGKWTVKNNKVILTNYLKEYKIHENWVIDKNQMCLRSRKGLEYLRLCHESCKNH